MELTDKIMMVTFVNGIGVPVEGRLSDLPDGASGFWTFIHATLHVPMKLNLDNMMNIMEVDRKDVTVGPKKIFVPGQGSDRLN